MPSLRIRLNAPFSQTSADDDLHALREENLALKKKLNLQDDRAKKLTTKVQRLSEDLLRSKELAAENGSTDAKPPRGARTIKGEFRNIEEAYDLIENLRYQIKELSKENMTNRNKMQYFRTLHEAETQKRTPYDHIPPRIQGSQKKRLHPGLIVKARPGGMASAKTSRNTSPEPQMHTASQEELEKLEEMNGMLRMKLSEFEAESEKSRQAALHAQEILEKDQRQHDVERAALQLELSEARKRERETAGKYDALDERFRAMLEAHHEALRVSDELNADLKDERRRCVEMEHELKRVLSGSRENAELLDIIEDLKEEKRLLEQEQANLLEAQFNRDREEEYQHEIEQLRENLRSHIHELTVHLDEKRAMHEEIEILKGRCRTYQEEKEEQDRHIYELQSELDDYRAKMNFFCKNGEIDLAEIEEALSIVRLRKERGISLDFLMEAEELYADKELLQNLRVQYADCIHELEKVRKLLYLQEHINKDYKLECEELNRMMEALKNGYELRLEEDSRLLDLRSNKIAQLEAQLKSIVYGTAKIPGEVETAIAGDDDEIELATGQNLVEIHIESALISDSGLHHIRKLGVDMEDPAKLTSFVHYDFFEFETQVSPMGVGQKPMFNYTAKYRVYTDDFFLQYLQSKNVLLYFAISNGLERYNVATCSVIMKELTDPDRTDRLRYYADLISTHDSKTIIGKVDFGLRVRLPMAQAIRAFKERTVALNLLTVSDKEVSSRRFRPRADTNDLVVRIIQCSHLKPPPGGRVPAVFASFQFYIHETIVTDTVRKTTSPLLNFLRIIPLPMTADLDRYLRTASLTVMVLDDNDGIEDFEYGHVSIPLLPLALGEKICDEFFLADGFGSNKSKLAISLEWSKPYKLNVVPLISLLDDSVASTNGRSKRAVHSRDDGNSDDDDDGDGDDGSTDRAAGARHARVDSDASKMDKYAAPPPPRPPSSSSDADSGSGSDAATSRTPRASAASRGGGSSAPDDASSTARDRETAESASDHRPASGPHDAASAIRSKADTESDASSTHHHHSRGSAETPDTRKDTKRANHEYSKSMPELRKDPRNSSAPPKSAKQPASHEHLHAAGDQKAASSKHSVARASKKNSADKLGSAKSSAKNPLAKPAASLESAPSADSLVVSSSSSASTSAKETENGKGSQSASTSVSKSSSSSELTEPTSSGKESASSARVASESSHLSADDEDDEEHTRENASGASRSTATLESAKSSFTGSSRGDSQIDNRSAESLVSAKPHGSDSEKQSEPDANGSRRARPGASRSASSDTLSSVQAQSQSDEFSEPRDAGASSNSTTSGSGSGSAAESDASAASESEKPHARAFKDPDSADDASSSHTTVTRSSQPSSQSNEIDDETGGGSTTASDASSSERKYSLTLNIEEVTFKHTKNERKYTLLQSAMKSHGSEGTGATIFFAIVSEPTAEQADGECEDIGFAKLDLRDVAGEHDDARARGHGRAGRVRRELQIWDAQGDILMGSLAVSLGGCGVLSRAARH
ncbi:X-linked retinitis pigmentosa GTPase regulator-interacting protein 1 [Entophlyctis luteolus]|nr:X-linked retinitis pigmentosa GTPase regulator-interacting protein 1 [Entophlyctis luteolus]